MQTTDDDNEVQTKPEVYLLLTNDPETALRASPLFTQPLFLSRSRFSSPRAIRPQLGELVVGGSIRLVNAVTGAESEDALETIAKKDSRFVDNLVATNAGEELDPHPPVEGAGSKDSNADNAVCRNSSDQCLTQWSEGEDVQVA